VSVTSGTRLTIPSSCFSVSVKAVDLLSCESRSSALPRFSLSVLRFILCCLVYVVWFQNLFFVSFSILLDATFQSERDNVPCLSIGGSDTIQAVRWNCGTYATSWQSPSWKTSRAPL